MPPAGNSALNGNANSHNTNNPGRVFPLLRWLHNSLFSNGYQPIPPSAEPADEHTSLLNQAPPPPQQLAETHRNGGLLLSYLSTETHKDPLAVIDLGGASLFLAQTAANRAFLSNDLNFVEHVEFANTAKRAVIALQKENQYLARRLGFWTVLGGVWAFVFFGETTATFTIYLQKIGAPLGNNPIALKYIEIATIGTNAPFNSVVSVEAIELILKHVANYVEGFANTDKYQKIKITILNTTLLAVEIAGAGVASLSFYAQILDAPLPTLIFSAFQILPNTIAGIGGLDAGMRKVGSVAATRIKIWRGKMTPQEHYARYIDALLSNLDVNRKRDLVRLYNALRKNEISLVDNYQAAAVDILLKRIMNAAEQYTDIKQKIIRSLFPAAPNEFKHAPLTLSQKRALLCFAVDLVQDQKLPLSPEMNLIIAGVVTALQFYSLYGTMELGNQALGSLIPGIEMFMFPHIVLGGMIFSFALKDWPYLLHNPILVAGSKFHYALFGSILSVFTAFICGSFGGTGPAILNAVLNDVIQLMVLSPYGALVLTACATAFSNTLASFGLILMLYISINIGIFRDQSLTDAVMAEKIITMLRAVTQGIFKVDDLNALYEITEERPDVHLEEGAVLTKEPKTLQHVRENMPQIPLPPGSIRLNDDTYYFLASSASPSPT